MGKAALYNNLNLPYGSKVITINGKAYIAENVEVTRPSFVLERYDELGAPGGQVFIEETPQGSALLQFSGSSAIPAIGDTFSMTVSGSAENWVVSQVGHRFEQRGFSMIPIEFRRVITGSL